eukprot:10778-Rhodomonas_salina.2
MEQRPTPEIAAVVVHGDAAMQSGGPATAIPFRSESTPPHSNPRYPAAPSSRHPPTAWRWWTIPALVSTVEATNATDPIDLPVPYLVSVMHTFIGSGMQCAGLVGTVIFALSVAILKLHPKNKRKHLKPLCGAVKLRLVVTLRKISCIEFVLLSGSGLG